MENRCLIEATCPECRGPLTEVEYDGVTEFHCLVGHKYSPEGLLRAHYEAQERALWAAVVALEESEKLVQAVAPHVTPEITRDLELDAADKRQQAMQIRKILDELKPYHVR